jgi:hypothetical protein
VHGVVDAQVPRPDSGAEGALPVARRPRASCRDRRELEASVGHAPGTDRRPPTRRLERRPRPDLPAGDCECRSHRRLRAGPHLGELERDPTAVERCMLLSFERPAPRKSCGRPLSGP